VLIGAKDAATEAFELEFRRSSAASTRHAKVGVLGAPDLGHDEGGQVLEAECLLHAMLESARNLFVVDVALQRDELALRLRKCAIRGIVNAETAAS
jgi:hypothetical protein